MNLFNTKLLDLGILYVQLGLEVKSFSRLHDHIYKDVWSSFKCCWCCSHDEETEEGTLDPTPMYVATAKLAE